jgi:glycosyltransferase involved in cell wall biosynthesis
MKVIYLNTTDIEGGAARGALRLMKGVRDEGVEARLLVQRKSGDDPFVIGPQTNLGKVMAFVRPGLESLYVGLCVGKVEEMFSPALMPDRVPARVAEFNPDIVHLHWVASGMMRAETLRRFNSPLVWTLHDSWPFTGGCHVPFDCTRYLESCGRCPVLGSSRQHDLSRRLWQRKQRAWHGLDLTVVAPSRWLAGCARSSSLFRNTRIEVIPNGLDLRRFKPVDRRTARELLSLPREKKLILFGGKWVTSDRNKGLHLLAPALRDLAGGTWHDSAEMVIFGSSQPERPPDLGLKTHYLGWLHDDVTLSLLYAAADLFVLPSIQENLSYAIMEAMACGTPCVAFDQGGMPDLIDHGSTGYLARPYEPDDLARGIAWVLESEERRREMADRARRKVESEFDLEKVARQHVNLYDELVRRPA